MMVQTANITMQKTLLVLLLVNVLLLALQHLMHSNLYNLVNY